MRAPHKSLTMTSLQAKRPPHSDGKVAKRVKMDISATLLSVEKENSANGAASKVSPQNTNADSIGIKKTKKLCKLDPSKLVDCAKSNKNLLKKLESFSEGLQRNLKRAKEENIMNMKQRLVDTNACFRCKKVDSILKSCVCFEKKGVGGNGILLCEDCRDQQGIPSCIDCCKLMCGRFGCNYQTCMECAINVCSPCIENDCPWKRCASCDKVYCSRCKNEKLEGGCGCNETEYFCPGCLDFETCDKCGHKVCDMCRRVPDCKDNVVLCSDCAYSYGCKDCGENCALEF